jgi:hypothetical protein
MRDVGRVADLIAQHDEADQRLAVVQTELDGAAVWLLLSLRNASATVLMNWSCAGGTRSASSAARFSAVAGRSSILP